MDPAGAKPQHSHKCKNCKEIWAHSRPQLFDKDEHKKAHTCPGCGKTEFMIHEYLS